MLRQKYAVQVLHVRNLPYEVTEEVLVDLCAAFGRLVQTKLNVGSNKNQAFVEFPDTQSAIQMVTYFSNSADPAKVSARTCPCVCCGPAFLCQPLGSYRTFLYLWRTGQGQDCLSSVLHPAGNSELDVLGREPFQCPAGVLGELDGMLAVLQTMCAPCLFDLWRCITLIIMTHT